MSTHSPPANHWTSSAPSPRSPLFLSYSITGMLDCARLQGYSCCQTRIPSPPTQGMPMVYKPTGRPPGRPKTKEYVTLMARVDGVLADQVKRYAALHRQPLSVVIRDALTLLMEEYPPPVRRSLAPTRSPS